VVVVDLTLFSMENRQPLPLIARYMRTFPTQPADNVKQMIFIGPNHPFKKCVAISLSLECFCLLCLPLALLAGRVWLGGEEILPFWKVARW
jgi:hypothetical protein